MVLSCVAMLTVILSMRMLTVMLMSAVLIPVFLALFREKPADTRDA